MSTTHLVLCGALLACVVGCAHKDNGGTSGAPATSQAQQQAQQWASRAAAMQKAKAEAPAGQTAQ